MRIAIVGAQGVGKTTLLKELIPQLDGYVVITERARLVMKKLGVESLRDLKRDPMLSRFFQFSVLREQISAEEEAGDNFISDRSVFDNQVYWDRWNRNIATDEENSLYYSTVVEQAKKYDLIVYIAPEIPLVDDGVRSVKPDYQLDIDSRIRGILLDSGLTNVHKVTGSVSERASQVMRLVNQYGAAYELQAETSKEGQLN